MTEYSYTKSPLNIDRLTLEIRSSSIVTALDHMSSLGDALAINFKADLSAGDQTTLNTLVTNHSGLPLPVPPTPPSDIDNAPLTKLKLAPIGWTFQDHMFEFTTSKLDSVYSKRYDGSDWNFCTMMFYKDVAGVETLITGGELTQGFLDTNCIKTIIDIEPNFDYDIIVGEVSSIGALTQDARSWVVAVPDIPAAYGGTKELITGGKNLRYHTKINLDGKVAKHLAYNSTYHTNKIRTIIRHIAGYQATINGSLNFYKA